MNSLLIFLALGIFFGFFIQTVIGFAGALVALPFLLIVMPLSDAVSYISMFYLISTPIYMIREWAWVDIPLLKRLLVFSVMGLGFGILVLMFGKPSFLKTALGIFIMLYVLYSLFPQKTVKSYPWATVVFGFLGGFFSGIFSTGGPLYVLVVKRETSSVQIFRATMFAVLGMVTIFRIPALVTTGLMNWSHVINSLLVLPAFFLALFLGKKLYQRLDEKLLKKIILAALFVSGLMLL